MNDAPQDPRLITHQLLMKLVGLTALLFPALLVGLSFVSGRCDIIQESISHYYYTIVGNVFVGALSAISVFLIVYKGYPNSHDNIATSIAGFFALMVALLPTGPTCKKTSCIVVSLDDIDVSNAHYISAAIAFLTLAYICLMLFRKKAEQPTKQKLFRNKIYLICGVLIIVSILTIGVLQLGNFDIDEFLCNSNIVFWLEWLALASFGFSWMVKGGFMLTDK